jgi:hypothetical protein
MYTHYKSHDYATLGHMDHALYLFHTLQDVFSLGQATKKAKAKANARRTELVKKRKIAKESHAET